MNIVWAIVVGILTGIISGFGIGGGSLLVVYLTGILAIDQYTAGGINLLYFLCCAPTALVSHIRHRRVEWRAVWWSAVCGVITAVAAAWIASLIEAAILRRMFGFLLLYVGVREWRYKQKADAL